MRRLVWCWAIELVFSAVLLVLVSSERIAEAWPRALGKYYVFFQVAHLVALGRMPKGTRMLVHLPVPAKPAAGADGEVSSAREGDPGRARVAALLVNATDASFALTLFVLLGGHLFVPVEPAASLTAKLQIWFGWVVGIAVIVAGTTAGLALLAFSARLLPRVSAWARAVRAALGALVIAQGLAMAIYLFTFPMAPGTVGAWAGWLINPLRIAIALGFIVLLWAILQANRPNGSTVA